MKGFNPGDINKMMREAQKVQANLMKMQEQLGEELIEGSSGGGAVKVVATGKHHLKSVKIAASAVDPEDIETLEDLVLTACNDAIEKANKLVETRMNEATGGMMGKGGLPGLF